MEARITIKHVNGLKTAKAKISDVGDLSHELTFDVLLDPGDLERVLMLFKQRIPITIEVWSPQSRMDLRTTLVQDTEPRQDTVVDPTTMAEVKGERRK